MAGNAAIMYQSTPTGWEIVDLGHKITFGSGASFPDSFDSGFDSGFSFADNLAIGDKLFGTTSGATCVITYFRFLSGSLDDGDAAADVFFKEHEGTFVVGEQIVALRAVTNGIGTITTANTDIAFPVGGSYEFDIYNFGGHASTENLYGVNGVGRSFEFDGDDVQFIYTGMTTDTPSKVIAHKKHLFLMFAGGSVQHSSIGVPKTFSVITGAAELGLGAEGTGFEKTVGGLLSIYARNKTFILHGTSSADWELREHSERSGAIANSLQRLADPIYLDDRGLTALGAVQEYGDFASNVLSKLIQPYLKLRTDNIQKSMVVREKNQYRLFFDDNTAIYCTFENNKLSGATIVDLEKKVTAAFDGEDTDGSEVLLFGSTDGYVYRLDSGTSFDGSEMISYIRPHYNHMGSPAMEKRYYGITFELDLQEPVSTDLSVYPDFSFSDTDVPKAQEIELDPGAGGGVWGEINWNEFAWGSSPVGEDFVNIDGNGRNLGMLLRSVATYERPNTIFGYTVDFAIRRRRR